MKFDQPLVPGTLIRREKRFLVHMRLASGEEVIAHTNNTGSMMSCNQPGSRVWLSPAVNPKRKLPWTYEIIESGDPPVLVGVNTIRANHLAKEAIEAGVIEEIRGYDWMKSEVKAGEGTRFDFLLGRGTPDLPADLVWVEVKNVTLVMEGRALFPDAVTERGRKHLHVLSERVRAGDRATLLFLVQRADALSFGPADDIDPAYGASLRTVMAEGVEVLAYRAELNTEEIVVTDRLPLVIE